ncbi:MAG: alanine--tRNA ligase [Acidobacteria bacterium]|nr:MAG: alanine--tRNA ligase [Acidobacteriota bacterium]
MTSSEIRTSFLKFFEARGHRVVASSSLVPSDDPTLLFTNAGMNQFKDVFLGKEKRDYTRATTVQKVMRVSGKHNDLDNVGPSHRHHTFFEMLGNFSFGDYFKKDAIPFAWELLTKVWGLDPGRLYPTIFKGENGIPRDDEAFQIWTQFVPAERITALGAADNFWSMGETGPCGRCSEIMYYRPEAPCSEKVCRGMECSCDRYFEVWNNVFMEFNRDASGALNPLPALSVDTGMGFERVTSVLQNKLSNYDTDIFSGILTAIGARAGRAYTHFSGLPAEAPGAKAGGDHPDVSMRVIADHLRAMTFLIADGVQPSNEHRGYVLRKIMRRAMRHGKKLGFTKPVLFELADVVIGEMKGAYPELARNRDAIVRGIKSEEERFDAVLTSGLPKLEELLERTIAAKSTTVSGDEVFRLYDSLGVPFDFAEDLAAQRGLAIDRAGYDEAMNAQKQRARKSAKFKVAAGATVKDFDETFVGYDATTHPGAKVLHLVDEALAPVTSLTKGQRGGVVLDVTPFYVESGGQISDEGTLTSPAARASVLDVSKKFSKSRVHLVEVEEGALSVGDTVTAEVDVPRRDAIRRNHTATHLLHAALRQTLGPHVRQKGSLVAPDRLRFDFAHDAPMSPGERQAIERIVNTHVFVNAPVTTEIRNTDDAVKAGAMALFGEKYGDKVRVVTVPGFSVELCGGTHVRATGDIGPFVITEESGVAAGIRRVEALTGEAAVAHIQAIGDTLAKTAAALNVTAPHAAEAVQKLQAEVKRLARENDQLKMKAALGGASSGGADDDIVVVGDAKFVARRVAGLEKDALRSLSDSLRDRLKRGVVVIAAENEGKVSLLVSVTKDLTDRVKAGALVKELAPIVGGGGGGRPDFAEAGGKDASKIDALLAKARELVQTLLT